MSASRESGTFLEDEGVMSIAAFLAKDASLSFHSGKFADCIEALNQLLQVKEDDLKVLHNIALAEYFQNDCSDPKKLIEMLNAIKKRSDDLTYGEQAETAGDSINKTITGSKGNNSSPHITLANSSHIGHGNKLDTSVLMLNIAVILFHLREYAKAFSILYTLYQKIEPIYEATALRICLLFLDITLILEDPLRFIEVINYVEKAFVDGNNAAHSDGLFSVQQQSSTNTITKSHSAPINTSITEASNAESPMFGNTTEGSLLWTLSDENLENLISTMDMTGQSIITRASNSNIPSFSNEIPVDQYISTNDLRLKLYLFKVRFMLLTKNIKAAKRELKIAMTMNLASGKDSSMALLLKSQLEYARGNYPKAIKLVMASSGNRTDQGISSICYNNLGCIYYRLGKQHASAIFFSKALNNLRNDEGPLKLTTFSQDKSLQITYNCGLQYLFNGKPLMAVHCFRKATGSFKDRPLLWLRIAECCLMGLKKGFPNQVKLQVIGKGKWRHLAVEDEPDDENEPTDLSISMARNCLLNALYLLKKKRSNQMNSIGNPNSAALTSSISDWEVSQVRNHQMIKQAVLASLAYLELELGNPLKSLSYAENLLILPGCSRIYIFLGNIYAAESLCLLDRSKEAADHLLVYLSNITGNLEQPPYTDDDCEQWKTIDSNETTSGFLKSQEGCGSLYSSLAALLAVQGDLEQAHRYVIRALTLIPFSPEAIITATYIDLAIGNVQEALTRLKQSSNVRFATK